VILSLSHLRRGGTEAALPPVPAAVRRAEPPVSRHFRHDPRVGTPSSKLEPFPRARLRRRRMHHLSLRHAGAQWYEPPPPGDCRVASDDPIPLPGGRRDRQVPETPGRPPDLHPGAWRGSAGDRRLALESGITLALDSARPIGQQKTAPHLEARSGRMKGEGELRKRSKSE
jgi:hypothetical protein